jgi:hypothetical protein
MPPKKGPVREYFTKFEDEGCRETPTGETKTRTKAMCALGCPAFVNRNVEQINYHMTAALDGLNKS